MKRMILVALLASTAAAPALAQVGDINSTSGSNAEAVSGSQSGAQSDNNSSQAQQQNNAGIGNSESNSASGAEANANTSSSSSSFGNAQGQDQGQSQGQSQNTNQTASQGNQQGVTVNQSWNTTSRKKTVQEFRTNAAVPLAASSSFSSDYCGGTTSGGASVAPLGVSIGAASPTFDNSCRYLRLAEKAGMLGANYYNMKQPDMSLKAMSLMAWATCMAGPQQDKRNKGYHPNLAMEACLRLGLLGSESSPVSPPPQPAPEPEIQQYNGQPTPEAVERYKTPRGDMQYESNPVIQNTPVAMASVTAP